ncbi:hypothetical protein MKW94_030454 [Papaver nudicaule]|uniref:Uncharacterized protein n=1 Tax=Papaver nudicaule TaxID=74823 RepID=A0AA41VX39_PAPNU|nr:hypothetical protein [Papaver nudicaule]
MEDYMRKLALWHTKTFKPIMTHEELEPIMAKLGFVGLPVITSSPSTSTPPPIATSVSPSGSGYNNNSWKEYYFTAGGSKNPWVTEPLPRPKLPYPRIDGLHHKTYGAFCDAVAFYINKSSQSNLADHFHVRGMPLHRVHDRPFDKKFRLINEDEIFYVYREGTFDPATAATIIPTCNSKINNNNIGHSNTGTSSAMDHRLVLLKDINHNIGISSHTIVS